MSDLRQNYFVNMQVDPETMEMISSMAKEDGFEFSRSAFMRRLIRQEYARRHSQPNPVMNHEETQEAQER